MIQEDLEKLCPQGIGFAIGFRQLKFQIEALISTLSKPIDQKNRNIPTDQARLACSWDPDVKSLKFDLQTGRLGLTLSLWLHPLGSPNKRIITLRYVISNAGMEVKYDRASDVLFWVPDSNAQIVKEKEELDPAAETYAQLAGFADVADFREEFLYGFIWVNARGLVRSLIALIPFPQVHQWLLSIKPTPPYLTKKMAEYICIWTEKANIPVHQCGDSPLPPEPPPAPVFTSEPAPPGPLCKWESTNPPVIIYYPMEIVAKRYASVLPREVTDHHQGGDVIKWEYDATTRITSFSVTGKPDSTGGKISTYADWELRGSASAWLEGPCNSKLDAASAGFGLKGDRETFEDFYYDNNGAKIYRQSSERIISDPGSWDLGMGGALSWVFGPITAELLQAVLNVTQFRIGQSYEITSHDALVDLTTVRTPKAKALRRLTEKSLLIAYLEVD